MFAQRLKLFFTGSTTVLLIVTFLMVFHLLIIVGLDGKPLIGPFGMTVLSTISIFISYVFVVIDKIKNRKPFTNVFQHGIKMFFVYLAKYIIPRLAFLIVVFVIEWNFGESYASIHAKNHTYYYEYYRYDMFSIDSDCENYTKSTRSGGSYYKSYKYLPFIGFRISHEEHIEIRNEAEVIYSIC